MRMFIFNFTCCILTLRRLDSNEFSSEDSEVASLLLLVNELSQVIEYTIESKKNKLREELAEDHEEEVVINNIIIHPDSHMEYLLLVSFLIHFVRYVYNWIR
jgi:hypothetical protein